MNTFVLKHTLSRSIFFFFPFFLLILVSVGIMVIIWFFWKTPLYWWICFVWFQWLSIIWYVYVHMFQAAKLYFGENSLQYLDQTILFSPKSKEISYQSIENISLFQKWFFAHVFWYGTLLIYISGKKEVFHYIPHIQENIWVILWNLQK